jgi:hypothetical protein
MRVWIISDKRWGDRDEEYWIAEVCHDPTPAADPDESVWDRVQYRGERFATKADAVAAVRRMKSNVCSSAVVRHIVLKCVVGDSYEWETDRELEEMECIYSKGSDTAKA